MSELITIVQQMASDITSLRGEIHRLQVLVMKDKVNDTWVSEEVAAEMLGYNRQSFRRKVKLAHKNFERPWCLIDFRNTNGRGWQYSRKSIQEFQKKTSSV